MSNTLDAQVFQARLQRLDVLLREVERFADPAARTHARELVRAVLEIHGVGLQRIVEHLHGGGAAGDNILDTCARDDVVSGLLLLHGLHPVDLETRVRQALEQVRPTLRAHGGSVQLVSIDGDSVRLRLEGSCHGCPSSAATMQQTIAEAIYATAPDVTHIEVEGLLDQGPAANGRATIALPLVSG